MKNYCNELRWKIIRANNLLQFIQQVLIRVENAHITDWFLSEFWMANQVIVDNALK